MLLLISFWSRNNKFHFMFLVPAATIKKFFSVLKYTILKDVLLMTVAFKEIKKFVCLSPIQPEKKAHLCVKTS